MTRAADYLSRLYEMLAGYHTIYMDRIRGDNPRAFTRKRKVLPLTVTVQILTQRGKAQRSEVDTVMRSIGADMEITDVGFYKARMKFDPEAIRRMSYDFVDSEMLLRKDELSRHGGYFVFAIDGSDVTLPSNIISDRIGKKGPTGPDGTTEDMPVQCKVSCLSDVLNHLIVRTEVDEYNHDERDHAMKLLKSTPEWLRKKALVVFDRGYYSIPLILCLEDLGFFYCFRLSSGYLRKEQAQTEVGQVRDIEVKPTLASTNGFRDDDELRKRCLERTFRMRMAKIDIGSEEGPEVLVTNLPPEDSDAEAMKKIYQYAEFQSRLLKTLHFVYPIAITGGLTIWEKKTYRQDATSQGHMGKTSRSPLWKSMRQGSGNTHRQVHMHAKRASLTTPCSAG